ncbi:MAG: hydroxyacid dehydrogenase [Clostridia bacterium]|nr:hydroxyacid dehydrogenase [Clostridia bacterium]
MNYDILFFEALGEEKEHLIEELEKAKARGTIPADLNALVVPETLQAYRAAHPAAALPEILSTKTHSVLPEEWIASGKKKSVITRSAGYDHFEALRDRVNVASLRNYCVNAVAETAVKLLMLTAGNFNAYEKNCAVMERGGVASFRELTGRRVTVFGAGRIGRRIYDLCRGMGMDVRAVDIRAEELKKEYGDAVRFITREEAARDSEAVICAMNYTADPQSRLYNAGYFDEAYLDSFPRGLLFVNVTRGEIAPEGALKRLYEKGQLAGIGLDVFSGEADLTAVLRGEKKTENGDRLAASALIRAALDRTANVYVQPHQAFNSDRAARAKAAEAVRHLEAWYRNGKERFDEQLPYYD